MFKIVADEAIPWLEMLFAPHGEIHRFSGRELDPHVLDDADLLLIRSTLKIDKNLLENSAVKLVASATVGCDHVDQNALSELGIDFIHAPGCNANAVAEYVIAAVAWHAKQEKINLGEALTAAVIGCGRIGSQVKAKLELLGFKVMVNDPPLQLDESPAHRSWNFVSLEDALQSDLICLHTPLTNDGDFPTQHLLDRKRIVSIRDSAVLINAGRGGVIDNQALFSVLAENTSLNVVLDVWENEPDINWPLLSKVNLGTPHIAGHSWRGKVMGTVMIYQQTCKFFNWIEQEIDENLFKVALPQASYSDDIQLYDLVSKCYDIEAETKQLRQRTQAKSDNQAAKEFDNFRKKYYQRAEFSDLTCEVKASIANNVKLLGFNVLS